ncbi:MAG: LysE family translocator [Bacteroidota bacterium]
MNYEILTAFVLTSSVLAISPGPDNIFVLTQSIAYGKRLGLATAFGFVGGCLVHTTLLAFGLSAVVKMNTVLFWAIKIFGACYLLFLTYKVYKSDAHIEIIKVKNNQTNALALFQKGFVMNVLNPKVTVFFLAFFPGFLFSDELGLVVQFYTLGLLFMLVTLVVFGSIALLAGSISQYIGNSPKTAIYLKWVQIIVFVGIALYLVLSDY